MIDALDRYVEDGKAPSRTEGIRNILAEFLSKRGYLAKADK